MNYPVKTSSDISSLWNTLYQSAIGSWLARIVAFRIVMVIDNLLKVMLQLSFESEHPKIVNNKMDIPADTYFPIFNLHKSIQTFPLPSNHSPHISSFTSSLLFYPQKTLHPFTSQCGCGMQGEPSPSPLLHESFTKPFFKEKQHL